MKKISLCISFFILSFTLFSAPVDPTTAAKVATDFYRQQTISKSLLKQQTIPELLDVTAQTPYQHMYVFNAEGDNGFVLVAGDDRSIPVLGYSDEGRFDYDNLPDNARAWIAHYEEELAWIVEHDAEPYETTAGEWTTLLNGGLLETKGGSVAPLIKTKWGQSFSNDRKIEEAYNRRCPIDNETGKHTLTGCVATAMAQIMKYWRHPAQCTLPDNYGNATYNWSDSNMPLELTNSCSDQQIDAIATLMLHCGVSVNMNYGVTASSSNIDKAATALKKYFNYSTSISLLEKNKYQYNEQAYINLLQQELTNGRPILYAGSGPIGGHAFVCDGYNNNYFHLNWGWNGDEGLGTNGHYLISSLIPDPDNGLDFSNEQYCYIGIQPAGSTPPSTNYDLSMYAPLSTNASSYDFGDDVTVSLTIANRGSATFRIRDLFQAINKNV